MVFLDDLWDDVVAGPQPERGLKHLKRVFTTPLNVKDIEESNGKFQESLSTPVTPSGLSPTAAKRDNIWRSVFQPGNNMVSKDIIGSNIFDKTHQNSPPIVYDCSIFCWLD